MNEFYNKLKFFEETEKVPKDVYYHYTTLDADLPDNYDKEVFIVKTELPLNHFIDMAVQGYGWVGSVA